MTDDTGPAPGMGAAPAPPEKAQQLCDTLARLCRVRAAAEILNICRLPFDAFGRGEQMTGLQRCTRGGTDPPQGPQRQGPAPDSPGAGGRVEKTKGER